MYFPKKKIQWMERKQKEDVTEWNKAAASEIISSAKENKRKQLFNIICQTDCERRGQRNGITNRKTAIIAIIADR